MIISLLFTRKKTNNVRLWRQAQNSILVPNIYIFCCFTFCACFSFFVVGFFLPPVSDEYLNRSNVLTTRRSLTFCLSGRLTCCCLLAAAGVLRWPTACVIRPNSGKYWFRACRRFCFDTHFAHAQNEWQWNMRQCVHTRCEKLIFCDSLKVCYKFFVMQRVIQRGDRQSQIYESWKSRRKSWSPINEKK